MAEVYRAAAAEGVTEALVIHCSSARFQQPFHAFLVEGLGLQRYALIAIPGGVQALTLVDYLPKFAWAGWRWVKFLSDLEKPPRIIFIGHEDCAWYRHLRFWSARAVSSRERITADLKTVGGQTAGRFPSVRVETYFARFAGGRAVFETV
jgi:hypothetical protein